MEDLIMTKKINYYDDFLTSAGEVQNMKPDLTKSIATDIDVELYLLPTSDNPKGYANAVVCVKTEDGTFRYKYEGGRVDTMTPEEMLDICVKYIRGNWDLDMWRKYAKEETQKQNGGWFKRLLKKFLSY